MPRSLLLLAMFVLVACASTQEGPFPPDAARTIDASSGGAADAAVAPIDAPTATLPDAGRPAGAGRPFGAGRRAAAGRVHAQPGR
jgi:hypothetical protein